MIAVLLLTTALLRAWPVALKVALGGDTSWIDIDRPPAATRRPVAIDDILSLREVQETAISPDGKLVAFLVRQAFRACNCYRTALYTSPGVGGGPVRKLLEEGQLLNLRWSPDGHLITFLSNRGGSRQVWCIEPDGLGLRSLFFHTPRNERTLVEALGEAQARVPVGVDQYEWSPDGSQVAFVAQSSPDSAQRQRVSDNGVVYDDELMWVFDLLRQSWIPPRLELWTYDLRQSTERLLWRSPRAGASSKSAGVWGIAWAPHGDRIAFGYPAGISRANGWLNHEIGLVTVSTGRFQRLTTSDSISEGLPAWSPDGNSIAYVSVSDWDRGLGGLSVMTLPSRRVRGYADHTSGILVPWLAWERTGGSLVFEATVPGGDYRQRSGVYRVMLGSGQVRRVSGVADHVSMCRGLMSSKAACVAQRPDVPPDPVLLDLNNGQTHRLATINSQLQELSLSAVKELQWSSPTGERANGYFLLPQNYVRGHRYPLVVVLYGFQGRFIAGAEWLTSYPAQVFAREGFAVLLCNPPARSSLEVGRPSDGRFTYGYGPLASIEAGVQTVLDMGVADSAQVGIMGWSYGGYLAQFALAHSSRFRVAAIGNGGGWSLGAYWYFGSRAHRQFYEKVVGGPPYGAAVEAWLRFFPASNPDRITAPLLMEFDANEVVAGLEMYTALRRQGKPVELVVYPDESHVFSQPVHRFVSMQRNLEWFAFWLLHRHPVDPKQEDRWRAMRETPRRPTSGPP